jgi:hypothetical protein
MRTLQVDFISQDYYRDPAASIEKLREFVNMVAKV